MSDKNMFDNEVLEDLRARIHSILESSRQFDRLAKNNESIRIGIGDRDYVRVRLQQTYATGTSNDVFCRASGLRIRFESSMYTYPVKTFMVPRWEKALGEWTFSRTKLLQKATAAVGIVKRGVARSAAALRERKAFAQLVDKEFKEYAETGEVRADGHRWPFPEVTIDHQQLIVTLTYTGNKTFRVRGICPSGYGHNAPCYSIPEIRELITELNEILTPREITLGNGEAIDDRAS